MMTTATPTTMDHVIQDLHAGLPSWVALPASERAALLRAARHRVAAESEGLTAAICAEQGISTDSHYAGEAVGHAAMVATLLQASEKVFERIAAGRAPVPASAVRAGPDGQVEVRVLPADLAEQVLFAPWRLRVDVRIQPGVSVSDTLDRAAGRYRGGAAPEPGVALVLGGGNFAFVPVMDLLHVMLEQGSVALLKLNPANDYIAPHLERIFCDLIERDWLRIVHGGPDLAGDLAHHPGIDRIHMTGSKSTFDALVWGEGEEAEQRRSQGRPLLDKPFSAELGGVNPCIVVPGPWSAADIRRQAARICWQKLHNCGHMCSAAQILVVPAGWEHTEPLLEEIRRLMQELPPRSPYYPRTQQRLDRAIADGPQVEALQPPDRRMLAIGLDPRNDEDLFTEEVFSDLLGVVQLGAPSIPDYLRAAVEFANKRLAGNLAAMLLAHPRTMREHGEVLEQAVSDLAFGLIGVNESPNSASFNGCGTWGAYPGNTPENARSGTGVVGNALLLDAPQKSVVRGAFRPLLKPTTDATHRRMHALNSAMLRIAGNDDLRALPSVVLAMLRG